MANKNRLSQKYDEVSYDSRLNFGVKGWWIVIFGALNWFAMGLLVNASLNIVVPMKAGVIGVDQGILLTWSAPARIVSLVFTLIVAKIMTKRGVKAVNGVMLILAAASTVLWGASSTVAMYAIAVILIQCFMNVNEVAGCNTVISNWFPKKKGIAIGWASMGVVLASVAGVPLLAGVSGNFGGIDKGLYVVAGIVIVIAILNFTTIKNYPEEWGCYPDNNPNEKKREEFALETGWTWLKILKEKEIWLFSIGCGFHAVSTIAYISTLIPTLIMKGFGEGAALGMFTLACAISMPGSVFFGFLDQKFGTQKSSIILTIWIFVGILFFFVPGSAGAWLYLIILGTSTGATNNYPLSITAQIFGRDGSQVAFPIQHVIKGAIIALGYGIMGQSLLLSGSYSAGWIIIAVMSVIAFFLLYFTDFRPKMDPIEQEPS